VIAVALIALQHRGVLDAAGGSVLQAVSPRSGDRELARPSDILAAGFLPFVGFVVFVIVASSNAVNLTTVGRARDWLHGDRGGSVGGAYLPERARHVCDVPRIAAHATDWRADDFLRAMVGSSIGFLWYNAHPAEIFMGDVARWRWAARLARLPL